MISLTDRVMMLTGGTTASVEDLKEAMGITDDSGGGSGSGFQDASKFSASHLGDGVITRAVAILQGQPVIYQDNGSFVRTLVQDLEFGYRDIGLINETGTLQEAGDTYAVTASAAAGNWIAGTLNISGTDHAFAWGGDSGPTFNDLGFMEGGTFTDGTGVSGDGRVVGFGDLVNEDENCIAAFLSDSGGGTPLVRLNPLAEGRDAYAYGIDPGGEIIVGSALSGDTTVPVYWTSPSEATEIDLIDDYTRGEAIGSTSPYIVGHYIQPRRRFFIFDGDTVVVPTLPSLYDEEDGDTEAFAVGIGSNGLYALAQIDNDGDNAKPWIWDIQASAWIEITVPEGFDCFGTAIQDDNNLDNVLVVGYFQARSEDITEDRPFTWTNLGGLVMTDPPPGGLVTIFDWFENTSYSPVNTLVAGLNLTLTLQASGLLRMDVMGPAASWQLRRGGNDRAPGAVDMQQDMGKNSDTEVADGFGATISGGQNNRATGWYAVIGGGQFNVVDGDCSFSVITGGFQNVISESDYCVIDGGQQNEIDSSQFSSILGGQTNIIQAAIISVILNGAGNGIVNATGSVIKGGTSNLIGGNYSSAEGLGATDRGTVSRHVKGAGWFNTVGDTVFLEQLLRGLTTDATPTPLTADGAVPTNAPQNNFVVVQPFSVMSLRGTVTAASTSNEFARFSFDVLLANATDAPAGVALVGAPVATQDYATAGALAWTITLDVDTDLGGLTISATGADGNTIYWACTVRGEEIIYTD